MSLTVWHSNTEEPNENKQILVCFELHEKKDYCYVCFYHKKERRFYKDLNPSFSLDTISKWSYIDELLNLDKIMSPEEIKILLKRKKKECLKNAEDALEKHDHNSEACNSYYCGKAAGIDEALQILGMLNKSNHINKNNK